MIIVMMELMKMTMAMMRMMMGMGMMIMAMTMMVTFQSTNRREGLCCNNCLTQTTTLWRRWTGQS